jgi:NTE family protein
MKHKKNKVGLVLGSGGGTKGIAHVALLEALHKAEIKVDFIVGCSIGSLFGAFYADGIHPKMIREIFESEIGSRLGFGLLGLPSLLQGIRGNGFFSLDRVARKLKKHLVSNNLEDLQIPMYVTLTHLQKASQEVFSRGEISKIVTASMSVPFFFQSVEIDGTRYMDGGITSLVPVEVARSFGPTTLIVSDIRGFTKLESKEKIPNEALRCYYITRYYEKRATFQDGEILFQPHFFVRAHDIYLSKKNLQEVYQISKIQAEKLMPRILASIHHS